MTLSDWFPALSSTGLFALAIWLGRNLILTRLQRSVGHELDVKLEGIRSNLRESEERLRSELRAKEAEISLLKSGAMSALGDRQAALDKRRLEAVDQVWAAVVALGPSKALTSAMRKVDFAKASARAPKDVEIRKMFELVSKDLDLRALEKANAQAARPYLPRTVWATYSAYRATALYGVVQAKLLSVGLDASHGMLNDDSISKLVKAALPHHAALVDKWGYKTYSLVVEELEEKLFSEIQSLLAGTPIDRDSLEQAGTVLALANEVLATSHSRSEALSK